MVYSHSPMVGFKPFPVMVGLLFNPYPFRVLRPGGGRNFDGNRQVVLVRDRHPVMIRDWIMISDNMTPSHMVDTMFRTMQN